MGIAVGCSHALPGLDHATRVVFPLPHHFPKYPGGVSLRFAMVHDVIHERFARHGLAYYRQRNRLVAQQLAAFKDRAPPDGEAADKYFALFDDLGAGHDYLGQHGEAINVLRDKLRKQQARGYRGRQLYTTYANLGTFLIHGNFRPAMGGSRSARDQLREGLAFIHQSIEVNPQAHFGREAWQAVAAEFLLAAMDNPLVLLKYDLVGNRLDLPIQSMSRDCMAKDLWIPKETGKGSLAYFASMPDKDRSEEELQRYREAITRVGAKAGWKEAARTSHQEPVPFDEPILGIIGMWRLGGGANPHFCLALGEIMLRVGQRHIAWCAFERAVRLADRFWPDRKIREQFIAHCRRRQQAIEDMLPDRAELRPRFEAELKHGQEYQRAYQEYEADRIARGVSLDDPHFYDDFHARHGQIASPVGNADLLVVRRSFRDAFPVHTMMLFAGLFGFGTACFLRFRGRRQRLEWHRTKEESA
jgi:hypothetical protein